MKEIYIDLIVYLPNDRTLEYSTKRSGGTGQYVKDITFYDDPGERIVITKFNKTVITYRGMPSKVRYYE